MPEAPLTPNNLSEQQLKAGYWFVTHKFVLKRIGLVLFILIDAGLVLFGGYGLIKYYLIDAVKQKQFEQELVSVGVSPTIHRANEVRPLTVGNAQLLAVKDTFDLVATVKNPNAQHEAVFNYRFRAAGIATGWARGFVLPNEEKFIVALRSVFPTRPASAELEIAELEWVRVNRHTVPDYEKFVAEHLNFVVTDVLYDPAFVLNAQSTIGKTNFTVLNNTGYGYHEVRMLVVQYRGSAIAGVNAITLGNLAPGEKRVGEVTWFEPLPAISQVRVIPEVDILNDNVYLRR